MANKGIISTDVVFLCLKGGSKGRKQGDYKY